MEDPLRMGIMERVHNRPTATQLLARTPLRPHQRPLYTKPHRFDLRLTVSAIQENECTGGSFEQPVRVHLLLTNNDGATWRVAEFKTFLASESRSTVSFDLSLFTYALPNNGYCLLGPGFRLDHAPAGDRSTPPWTKFALQFAPPVAVGDKPNSHVTVSASATISQPGGAS
jgi:hypothetical protein